MRKGDSFVLDSGMWVGSELGVPLPLDEDEEFEGSSICSDSLRETGATPRVCRTSVAALRAKLRARSV